MKSVLELLKMDHKHLQHQLCHPRRQASFDNSAIQKKLQQVRQRKQQLRVQAQRKHSQFLHRQQRFSQFPLQQILQQSLQPLQQCITLLIKQKIKFIQDKVYIGAKNNINHEYINRIIDQNQAKPTLKNQLNLFMEELITNIQDQIVNGNQDYQITIKKDIPTNKSQSHHEINPSRLINIKKVQLSNKIQQLREELSKTQLQQEKLVSSPPKQILKKKSFSIKSASVNGSHLSNSLNLDEFSIKSQKTKQAEQFVKKLQQQQTKQRTQRKKKQQQYIGLKIKQQQQKKQFQQQLKNQKHLKLKKKFQQQRQQKSVQIQKSAKAKAQYQKFLSQYRKRIPLYKQKQLQFSKKLQKQQKQRQSSVLTQIKQTKRSIDISQLKQHQQKYKSIKAQSQQQKLMNLKHRQKQIELRHKQDKMYFRGRYHSMIKEEEEKVPQDPMVGLTERLKKKKQFAEKIKKQHVPQISPQKHKQLQQLIHQLNRNKPTKQSKDYNQLGNKYLSDLHNLLSQLKSKHKTKISLPQQLKPRYKNYLSQLKKQRQYQTISYQKKDQQYLQKQAIKIQQNIKRKQKILKLTNNINIDQQLKRINELDLELLKSAQVKANLLMKVNNSKGKGENSVNSEESQYQYYYEQQ